MTSPAEKWAQAVASALLGPDPIIWVWTERFGAQPWAGNGLLNVDELAEQLQKIESRAPDNWVQSTIYFLATIEPGETELHHG